MSDADSGTSLGRTLSVVVPCFNEQEVVGLTHQRLLAALGGVPELSLEIVYVDDGSSDDTPAILARLSEGDDRVVVVTLTRNFGHQAAVTAGLKHAAGDAVVVIDADLQDPPEVIPAMLEKWRAGYEVVYGVRAKRREAWAKRASYATFYRVLRWLAHVEVPLDSGDFALLDRQAVDMLNSLPERVRFVRGLRAWIGLRQIGLSYQRPLRPAGRSKYSTFRLVKLGLDGIFSMSSKPLTLISLLGIAASACSVLGFVLYLAWRLSGVEVLGVSPKDVPGFTSIILLLLLLSGIQLISIGIIGEYIARIYDETKERPTYLSRDARRARKGPRPQDPPGDG